jgi:lactose/L-arabinose transport system substrate-binding protein
MKKIFSLILSLAILVSLAACGAPEPTTQPPDDTQAPAVVENGETGETAETGETTETEETGETGEAITVWCWDPAFNIFAMEEAANIYKGINPNFEIDIIEVPWDDVQTRLITIATAGQLDTLPDIFLCQDNAFQKNVINFPEIFADLTDSGIDFNSFGSAKVAYSVINGRHFGVPFDNGTVINALRTDVLEEAGHTIDDFRDITWDRYIELGMDILERTGKPIMSDRYRETDLIMIMLQSTGASMFNADGSPNIADNAELKESMRIFVELIESGVCEIVNNWDEYIASFVNGDVAGTINGCWILGSIQTADDQAGNWALTNLPRMNTPGATNYSNNGGSSWAISSSSQNMDLAVSFLANTFAGSVEFYEAILPASGAIGTWIPAAASTVYAEPHPFFGGQSVFADIVDFAGRVPSNYTGVFYYEARDAVGIALAQVVEGADLETALREAEDYFYS